MGTCSHVVVFSDTDAALPELISGARTLGERVIVLGIGDETVPELASRYGADAVVIIPRQENTIIEEYVPSFAAAIRDMGCTGLLMLPTSRRGKCVAAKLGSELQCAVVNECAEITTDNGISAKRMVYGGLAFGVERIQSQLAIVTVGPGVFEAVTADAPQRAEVKSYAFLPPAKPIKLLGRHAKPGCTVDLRGAKRVVSAGRGFSKKEDLTLAENLAQVLGAEVGCTRPIAEGEGWMAHERYIGVSGVMLKSDLYVALGISGQIQHMVGANGAKTIIAINKDKNAPIFNSADVGIVGDIYKVVPALIEGLK